MANYASSVMTVGAIAATTRNPMAIAKACAKPSCAPILSAAVCAASLALSASPETPSPVGSKKAATLPPLPETLIVPDETDADATTLELDELWSFVLNRSRKRWIWMALCRKPRQVVAYFIGERSRASWQRLWERLPMAYRRGRCGSDFWAAYQLVIPAEQHTAAGKETGLTAHVERWHHSLRQRLGRFVRKSKSFSKSEQMHENCLRLFLQRYNLALASPA